MIINEHAKYYKSRALFLHPFLPRERLVASPGVLIKYSRSRNHKTQTLSLLSTLILISFFNDPNIFKNDETYQSKSLTDVPKE